MSSAKMNSKKGKRKEKNSPLELMLPPHPFDPTECVHEWTMWRVAVNRCIVNKVMSSEDKGPKVTKLHDPTLCLLHVPLKKFIRLGFQSEIRAQGMSGISNPYCLDVNQFVYYGIPRPKVKRDVSRGFRKIPVDEFAARYT